MSGSRVIEVDADSTPWGDVDEGGEFEEEETPNLKQIKYAIKKRGNSEDNTRTASGYCCEYPCIPE